MGFDAGLLAFLEREQVPATLFINVRWIGPNRQAFDRLAANPLFEIANHGLQHQPASVTGRSVYGLDGTRNVAELVDEIELGAAKIAALTGRRPHFYRAGTAYYDEVAVQVAAALGQQVVGFSVLGDKGATYDREEVKAALLSARARRYRHPPHEPPRVRHSRRGDGGHPGADAAGIPVCQAVGAALAVTLAGRLPEETILFPSVNSG